MGLFSGFGWIGRSAVRTRANRAPLGGPLTLRVESTRARAAAALQIRGAGAGVGPADGPGTPITDDLSFRVAVDLGARIVTVSDAWLARRGISRADAERRALQHLRKDADLPWLDAAPGTLIAPWEDGNAASRLLLPDVLARLPVRGRPVLLAPCAEMLVAIGDDDVDALGRVISSITRAFVQERPLSARPWLLSDGELVPWMPSDAARAELVAQLCDLEWVSGSRQHA